MIKKITLLLISLSLCIGAFAVYSLNALQSAQPVYKAGDLINVSAGQGLSNICRAAIVDNSELVCTTLKVYAKLHPEITKLKAGLYEYSGESLLMFISKLTEGDVVRFSFTIVEGTTYKQLLGELKRAPYMVTSNTEDINRALKAAGLIDENPEGWFYPETYQYQAGDSDISLLLRAYREMVRVLDNEWAQKQAGLPISTQYEALILASLIEKESGKDAERPLISSVFKNRLNLKMRLQTDPTVIYGLGDAYQGDIKRVHLKQRTPYNTYQINGLPPTPIAMPSIASIRAALHPTESEYLYFVASGDGGHYFSKTLAEHNRAVRKFILNK